LTRLTALAYMPGVRDNDARKEEETATVAEFNGSAVGSNAASCQIKTIPEGG